MNVAKQLLYLLLTSPIAGLCADFDALVKSIASNAPGAPEREIIDLVNAAIDEIRPKYSPCRSTNWRDFCPNLWSRVNATHCSAPPWYQGPCSTLTFLQQLSVMDKIQFEIDCDVRWPCSGGPKRQDFHTKPRPDRAKTYSLDLSYRSQCSKSFESLQDYSPAYKEVVAEACGVFWPPRRAYRCTDTDRDDCPSGGWYLERDICKPPTQYQSHLHEPDCGTLSRQTECDHASECNVEYRADQYRDSYLSRSDYFLRSMKSAYRNHEGKNVTHSVKKWIPVQCTDSTAKCPTFWHEVVGPDNSGYSCFSPPQYLGPCSQVIRHFDVVNFKKVIFAACDLEWAGCSWSNTLKFEVIHKI